VGDEGGIDEGGLDEFFEDGTGDFEVFVTGGDVAGEFEVFDGAAAAFGGGDVEPVLAADFTDEVFVFGAAPGWGEVDHFRCGKTTQLLINFKFGFDGFHPCVTEISPIAKIYIKILFDSFTDHFCPQIPKIFSYLFTIITRQFLAVGLYFR